MGPTESTVPCVMHSLYDHEAGPGFCFSIYTSDWNWSMVAFLCSLGQVLIPGSCSFWKMSRVAPIFFVFLWGVYSMGSNCSWKCEGDTQALPSGCGAFLRSYVQVLKKFQHEYYLSSRFPGFLKPLVIIHSTHPHRKWIKFIYMVVLFGINFSVRFNKNSCNFLTFVISHLL